jgi:hypothetical protein
MSGAYARLVEHFHPAQRVARPSDDLSETSDKSGPALVE